MIKQSEESYKLILLTEDYVEPLFHWNMEEKSFEYYTCRPLKLCKSLKEYTGKTLEEISEQKKIIYVLVNKENQGKPLGKITLFDINPRNHSAEFGYYLPSCNRGHGLGSIMLCKFLHVSFQDEALTLNKIYATTASNNYPSIKLLEKYQFKLDGRLREHYYIHDNKYDQFIYSILRQEWENNIL